jgi:8-oxo-dGTP pyrophosphatase MutT (NUDIX family)
MNKNMNLCNNCGKSGHLLNQCKLPIISCGIILFKKELAEFKYLMLRRKDSFGYIDFVRGKYSPFNIGQIQSIVNEMSNEEKRTILANSFDFLWRKMWGERTNNQYKNEELTSQKKMEIITKGVSYNDEIIMLKDVIKNSNTSWDETEWEFTKGRKNIKEKDIECALREFEEETGISKHIIHLIENILPFEEIFIGTNHKSYKHKYYLAFIKDNDSLISLNNFQVSEVSKLEWKTVNECVYSIRPYNLEKIKLILNIDKVLKEYRLY